MWQRFAKVTLKTGKEIECLPGEVEGLRRAGLLMEEKPEGPEDIKKIPEDNRIRVQLKPAYKLPILTTRERRSRIKQARKLKRKGYSMREIARRLSVSHTAVGKWFK